jgi:hypothetical protein
MALVGACGSDGGSSGGSGAGAGTGGAGTGGGGTGGSTADFVGVHGLSVTQVAVYQGPERILALGGAAQPPTVPLVAGRDAMVRIFYTATPETVGQSVVGRVELGGNVEEAAGTLVAASTALDLASTINVPIPGELVGASFDYRVSVLAAGTGDNPSAHHPVEGLESHVVDGPQNTARILIVPFQYNADGSGRVPDTSPEALQGIRDYFYSLYPVSNAEVTVAAPIPWSGAIQPNGAGWQEVGLELFGYRGSNGVPADVYLYGMFDPADSFAQFCGMGCLLGVTLLNNQPPDVGDPSLRLALGVGFPQVASGTLAHEIGHAHGRGHAPCGPGLDPNSIDPSYPYSDGSLGTHFYDLIGGTLVDGAAGTDVMGYCDNQFISDYNFAALLARGSNVNLPKWHAASDEPAFLVTFDAEGRGQGSTVASMPAASTGSRTRVTVVDGDGSHDAQGMLFRYDHLPGGWLFLPKRERAPEQVDLVIDGRPLRVAVKPR